MKSLLKKHELLIFIVAFVLIKQLLVLTLPINAYSTAGHDDRLMINFSNSILHGDWLGSYSEMTLVKGSFFPFFLAVDSIIGIPYTMAITLLYSFSCIVFIIGIKSLFKTKISLYIMFFILLFNPVTYADDTFLRVYRNCLTASQILIITGCMFAIYFNRNKKIRNIIPWSIGSGIGLASLWHTREDGIWIIPFIFIVIIITLFSIFRNKDTFFEEKIIKGLFVFLPIIFLLTSSWMIAALNYSHYGIFTTNELNKSNFTKVIKLMYSVQPSEDIDYVSVPRSTMNKLYVASPALNSIKNDIESSLDQWSAVGKKGDDLEVEDGWFFWSIRSGVSAAGYYENAKKANEFYEKISKEIESGFSSGKLIKRGTMPSALMSPWKASYADLLPQKIISTYLYVATYDGVQTQIIESIDDKNNGIRIFERITNNLALYPGEDSYQGDHFRVKILNKIAAVYQKTGLVFFLVAIFCYLVISFLSLTKNKREKYELEDTWLVLTGLLGSMSVLILGVSYTDISAYSAILYSYLSGAYPLMISFEIISISVLIENLIYNYLSSGGNYSKKKFKSIK